MLLYVLQAPISAWAVHACDFATLRGYSPLITSVASRLACRVASSTVNIAMQNIALAYCAAFTKCFLSKLSLLEMLYTTWDIICMHEPLMIDNKLHSTLTTSHTPPCNNVHSVCMQIQRCVQ